jgi:hypothetical protein
MVAAFGTGWTVKTERWITLYPRLDRGSLARLGVLAPGKRTKWVVRDPKNPTSTSSIELVARQDGLELRTGDRVQVALYYYDRVPCGSLRQFWRCPSCSRITRSLYYDGSYDGSFGCRVCLSLRYVTDGTPSDRILAAHRIAGLRRSLARARPGSAYARRLAVKIGALHKILTADVARIRRDLQRRLKNDYKRS